MYLAFTGELTLIAALVFLIWQLNTALTSRAVRAVLQLTLLFIALTASLGALRYLGVDKVIPLHDSLSYLSRFIAMPLYACILVFCWGRLPHFVASVLLLAGGSPLVGVAPIATDVVIVAALLRLIQCAADKGLLLVSLSSLLLVPVSTAAISAADPALGLFHLLLGIHFATMALALRQYRRCALP